VVYATPRARLPPVADLKVVDAPHENDLQTCPAPAGACALQAAGPARVTLDPSSPAVDDLYAGAVPPRSARPRCPLPPWAAAAAAAGRATDARALEQVLRLTSGAAEDQSRHILAYNGTERTAVLHAPLAPAPSAGDTYALARFGMGPDRAVLTWRRSPGATKYKVVRRARGSNSAWADVAELQGAATLEGGCRRSVPGASGPPPSVADAGVLCWELTGLTAEDEVEVAVAAGDANVDWGLLSAPLRLAPLALPEELPSAAQVVAQTVSTASLAWAAPRHSARAPTTFYRLFSRKVGAAEWTARGALPVQTSGAPGYRIDGLERGHAYDFRVLACNLAGVLYPPMQLRLITQASNIRCPPPRPPLPIPRGVQRVTRAAGRVTAARAENCTGAGGVGAGGCAAASVTLEWDAPPLGTHARLYARLPGAAGFQPLPATAAAPYGAVGAVIGPNVTRATFDRSSFPDIDGGVNILFKARPTPLEPLIIRALRPAPCALRLCRRAAGGGRRV
jgi:hypothetical protein